MGENNIFKLKLSKFQFLRIQSILIILIIVVAIFSFLMPRFLTLNNFINILKQISISGIVAVGATLLLINGDMDLSVGSLFSLIGVMTVKLLSKGILISIIVPLAVAILVGFINGYITTKFNINSVIVTLGMLAVLSGVAYLYTEGGNQLVENNSLYPLIGGGKILGIPNYIIIFIIISLILAYILHKTVLGRNIYLIGVNREAARIAGIKINKIKIILFIISSVCVAIAAITQSSRMLGAAPNAGTGLEFIVVTIVLVGGTSFLGGRGSILNTILGALLIGVLVNAMILGNVSYAFQDILRGLLLIIALFVDAKARSRI